jgi:hypothetical protein
MASLQEKNAMKRVVLAELAELCKKLSDNSAITEDQRLRLRQFVEQYNSLTPFSGKGIPDKVFEGEKLLIKIARFLPEIAED